MGFHLEVDPNLLLSNKKSKIKEGFLLTFGLSDKSFWYIETMYMLSKKLGFSIEDRWEEVSKENLQIILYGDPNIELEYEQEINLVGLKKPKTVKFKRKYEGLISFLMEKYENMKSQKIRVRMEQYMAHKECSFCKGKRLNQWALNVYFKNKNIHDTVSMSVDELSNFFANIRVNKEQQLIAKQLFKEICLRLKFLKDVGLGYLTLNRLSGTLSGGESQRIRLATQIGSALVGVLYILDEPSIGLHHSDNVRLINTLKHLRDIGNTIIVVEHDEDTILSADYVVDIGLEAGLNGGEIIFAGKVKDLMKSKDSITAQYLTGLKKIPIPVNRRNGNGDCITVHKATQNNLKKITVKFPLAKFIAVTGISGSGKSTLVRNILYKSLRSKLQSASDNIGAHEGITGIQHIDKVIEIDQDPIGRTPRSNPATYTGLFAPVREIYSRLPESKARGYTPGRFSFNMAEGRCSACEGEGIRKIEMYFLNDVFVTCKICKGKRYNKETLSIKYKGKTIYDILQMTVIEAVKFFSTISSIHSRLKALKEVGLGYIRLGQSATTLSGGEAQRVKLASELCKRATGRTFYILDEPTTGLHFEDINNLLKVLHRFVNDGNTVVVIEHNLDVVKTADHVIDLGPEGGSNGGYVVGYGSPEELVQNENSVTGRYLKKYFTLDSTQPVEEYTKEYTKDEQSKETSLAV